MRKFFDSRLFAAMAALASGLLALVSDYPNPVAFLAWIAPVPVLALALRRGFPFPRPSCGRGGTTTASWT